jgi:putative acetyltransferase
MSAARRIRHSVRVSDAGIALTIRQEEASDRDAISAVVSRAFGSSDVVQLVSAIRASSNYVPNWSLVRLTDDGRIVGHVMVSYATVRDATSERRIANLSPLSVDPDYQRRGIGASLVRAVASRVDDAGEPLIVLEGSPVYYSRFGFEYAVPLGITMKLPEWAPPEAAQVLRLSNYDSSIRGNIVYPPAFDEVADPPSP